ncbi:MAG: helix-turn-helix transcriptional regulator [Actinobacteria bacterium]|nr:helix-turn-helix transcriptional regulator [Actinomycetota bacterium]
MRFEEYVRRVETEAAEAGPAAQRQLALFRSHYRLARQVLQRRRALGLTQEQLAAAADVRQSEISRIENGRGNPTVLTLARLADALGLEVSLRLPSDGATGSAD